VKNNFLYYQISKIIFLHDNFDAPAFERYFKVHFHCASSF